jgi:plastocyanin
VLQSSVVTIEASPPLQVACPDSRKAGATNRLRLRAPGAGPRLAGYRPRVSRALLTVGIVAATLSATACGGGASGSTTAGPAIRVSGGSVANEFSFTPAEVRVRAGQAATVEFYNTGQILHDFSTRGQAQNVTLVVAPGSSRTGTFTPADPGRSEFFCGQAGHEQAGMKGTLIVE